MESPPTLPLKPLGRTFYIVLLAPIVSMALAAGLSLLKGSVGDLGAMLSLATLLAMFVCSVICAIMVGRGGRMEAGIVAFVGIVILYIGVAFAGCATVMQGVSFH